MIRVLRTTTAGLALAFTLLAGMPRPLLADDGTGATPGAGDHGTPSAHSVRIDLEKFLPTQPLLKPAPDRSFADTTTAAPGAHGWSSYSTAKKTWIIVGIAVGVAGIAVAVSGHHGGGGSGGGGGY